MMQASWRLWLLASILLRGEAVEFRGSSSNPATFKKATQSSNGNIEAAFTTADRAVDGDYGGHLYFSNGCAITDWQANPWWSVDLEAVMPMAVIRIYPRTDNRDFTMTGLQVRAGLQNTWEQNPACSSGVTLQTVGVTAVNCFAGARYVFIGAPNTERARLAICEIDVVMRGPKEVKTYTGAIGRPLNIRVEGLGFLPQDRIRVVHEAVLCGTAAAFDMDSKLVERAKPYGGPVVEDNENEVWEGVEFLTMGFYKVCWCSGMFSCQQGTDFTFIVGFAVITGEMRTVAGDGDPPVADLEGLWEDFYSSKIGAIWGLALSDDGETIYFSEPHRVREANLVNGSVRTIVGDLNPGNCLPPFEPGDVCGDGGPGLDARLHEPMGLAVCRGELLIADYRNARIRAWDLETGIITTKVGSTVGYSGDGLAPTQARLNGPTGVACDSLRGYWIADTGNSAIRGVLVVPGQSDVISTVIGGLGQGLAPPGTWTSSAQLGRPMQIAMSNTEWGSPRSLAFVDALNAVARFVPLGTRVMEGAVQQVIGTGSTGYRQNAAKTNLDMDNPEGIAAHHSTVFVSDTANHRIIMVPILEYESLGCFEEVTNGGEGTLIQSLEGDVEGGLLPARECSGTILNEPDAVARCATATVRKGWDVFAVRCGGVCATALDAGDWYRFMGASTLCEQGRGGLRSNSVYRLVKEHAKDLLGRYWVIAGQAYSTEALAELEPPRPGYFGNRLASWISAMENPSQLAAHSATRNLFFGDRGNYRLRVIFGSLGPQPQVQQFYCTNGLPCTLTVQGNGFSEKDHLAFSRDYFTAPVVCGMDRLEDRFPQVYNLAVWSRLFLYKQFELGRLAMPIVGQFIVCYCIGNVGKECDVTEDYEFKAGRLHVIGPNTGSTTYALAGVPFDIALFGAAFRLTDRIRLILRNQTCGAGGNTPVNDVLPFLRIPGNISRAGMGPWDEGSGSYQVWRGVAVDKAVELKVCWCDEAPCPFDSYFKVEAMYISVQGPVEKLQVVEYGQPFDLLVEGTGGFKAADRIRLQSASTPCYEEDLRVDLVQALPEEQAPCEVSGTSVRWCGIKLPLSVPSSIVACWCGALGGCSAVNASGVAAVYLDVQPGPLVQGLADPAFRRDPPPPAKSEWIGWANYINSGTYNVSVRMASRKALGAGSPGPVHVAICEMPGRCLDPIELRELPGDGGLVEAWGMRTWSGTTLFPRGVMVTSLSTDAYLADFVDVALMSSWRRFPLNRWILLQEEDAFSGWEIYTPPPIPRAAPTRSFYTEGDLCGGCGLGMVCRERPKTALELAIQGISLEVQSASAVSLMWDCEFACGDGLVVGEEECDDGGLEAFDGCDASCKVEPGFVCDGAGKDAPSTCRPLGCGPLPHPQGVAPACVQAPTTSASAIACHRQSVLDSCTTGGALEPPELLASCDAYAGGDRTCQFVPARPKAVLADLVDEGRVLIVVFDAPLNGTDYGTELPCGSFFAPATVAEFGDAAVCLQGSSRHIVVRLGFGAPLGIAEESTAVLLLDAARQYAGIDAAMEVARPFEYPSQRVYLGPALGSSLAWTEPVVILRGPNLAGACGDVIIDATASSGNVGRPWKSTRWRCTGDPSRCAEVRAFLPNCNTLTPGLATAGLDFGAAPCGLRATIPEATASSLTISLATVVVYLRLENTLGQWSEASHTLSFTVDRIPVVVALTSREIYVDQGQSIRLELSVSPALPVASAGAGSVCGALGPIAVEWRYGLGNLDDVEQVWDSLLNLPSSLIPALDAKTATLQGFLGSLDAAGTNWTFVARVAHLSATAKPVFMPFVVAVRSEPVAISLQAPTEISDQCPFSITATTSGIEGSPYITWRCVLMDIVPVQSQDVAACAAAASQSRGPLLGLPVLIPGVYKIEAELDTEPRPTATVFVHVRSDGGPRVHLLEPLEPETRASLGGSPTEASDMLRLRARFATAACGETELAAAVVVLSSTPGERLGSEARPSMILGVMATNISDGLSGDDNFEAAVPLSSLSIGLSHTFQLLVASGAAARQAMRSHISNLDASIAASLVLPPNVWAYYSAPVTRVLPPAAELFVSPAEGFAMRTLFALKVRVLCLAGCQYAFRVAPRAVDVENMVNATGPQCSCSRADGSAWQDLRTWSAEGEDTLPLLAGTYILEARVRSPDGGMTYACAEVSVTDSDAASAIESAPADEAAELISTWTTDASRSMATLRALGRPELVVTSLESISSEFPRADALAQDVAMNAAPELRQLYAELTEGAAEAVYSLGSADFAAASSRRLSESSTLLATAMNGVLRCMSALHPLLTLTELWNTLGVLDAVVDRNSQVRGVLGPGPSGKPLAAAPLLALADLTLVKAYYLANSTISALIRSNSTALVDRVMAATLSLGSAAAATVPLGSGPPEEVSNPGRGVILSSKSFPTTALQLTGLSLDLTTQTIVDRPYPGLQIPQVGSRLAELRENVTSQGGPPLCLGSSNFLFDRLELVIMQWGFNVIAVGDRLGSGAPSGVDGVLISVRDLRLQSCGVPVPITEASIDGAEVEMLVELPEAVIEERRWGYGDVTPFRCVRWLSSGIGRPGIWSTEGCRNVYRAKEDPAVGEKAGLAEGVLRCRCSSLMPGTWAVEIVPRPPIIVIPPEVPNSAVRNLVTWGVLILWLPFLVPFLLWALMGDWLLALGAPEATRRLAEGLLPGALAYGGVWQDAEKPLALKPWPLRSGLALRASSSYSFLRSLCGQRRGRWKDEAKELSRYRDGAILARMRGARVLPLEDAPQVQVRALEDKAATSSSSRAPVARWRKAEPAPPAAPAPEAAAVDTKPNTKSQPQKEALTQAPANYEQPRDEIGALLKWDEDPKASRQAAMNLTENDWSDQVRGQVKSTGVQRANALPEGWIAQSAAAYGGQVYYVNLLNGQSCWEVPTQPAVKVLSTQEIRELLGPASDGVALRRQLEEMLRPRIQERLAAMSQSQDVATGGAQQERRTSLRQGLHRAPPPDSNGLPQSIGLREAANATGGEVRMSLTSDLTDADGSIRLPRRFRALAWGPCTLFFACWVRSWPVTAALLPQLRPSRLERAAKLAYRLNAALAFAAGICGLQDWGHGLNEAVAAETRPEDEVWAELAEVFTLPMTIAFGFGSVLVAWLLVALLPVFPTPPAAKEMEAFGARSSWWRRAWSKQHQTEGFALFLALGAGCLAAILASWRPQPRAAMALAAFIWALLAEMVLVPAACSCIETMVIYCAARGCCCGQATLLARCPGLLRFPHKGSWTSRDLLLRHVEAVLSETSSPRHVLKAAQSQGSQGPKSLS